MSLARAWSALWAPDRANSTPDPYPERRDLNLVEPPFRVDTCPDCGGEYFAAGGPVTEHESNGERARIRQESAILSCLTCGSRWFGTPDGLRKPHEAALPPAWAMHDLQERMRKAQDSAARERLERQEKAATLPKPRGPHAGFRTPPKPS